MQIRTSSDWRQSLPFETPIVVSDVAPGPAARCAACGTDAADRPRTDLWAVKHRHPNNPAGFVRFYCAAHRPAPRPAPEPVAAAVAKRSGSSRAASGSSRPAAARTARRDPVPERVAPLCPDCFVEVPPSGVCGMCGAPVA